MTLRPLLPGSWFTLVLVALVLAGLLVWSARWALRSGASRATRRSFWRRTALAVVTVLVLAGPSVRESAATSVSTTEVYLVVDETGSMGAEDWAGSEERLVGVKQDLTAIRKAFPDARFSIIGLGSSATRELPLTSDTGAVASWIDALHQEVTSRSTGSSLERALPLLSESLTASKKNAPEDARVVYILSDGEATDDGTGASDAKAKGLSWSGLKPDVDAGAVLGYGTSAGGRMKEHSAGATSSSTYIKDPTTGKDAVSKPDTSELASVAKAMGVSYYQRTGGSKDVPTKRFTHVDVSVAVTEDRRRKTVLQYAVWPLGIIAALLLAWEGVALARSERALRRLGTITPEQGPGPQGGGPRV